MNKLLLAVLFILIGCSANNYYNKGIRSLDEKDYPRAAKYFSKVINKNPADEEALTNRGFANYLAGNFENAFSNFNTAIQINPENGRALYNRALVYIYYFGDTVKACLDAQSAVGLSHKQSQEFVKEICI